MDPTGPVHHNHPRKAVEDSRVDNRSREAGSPAEGRTCRAGAHTQAGVPEEDIPAVERTVVVVREPVLP